MTERFVQTNGVELWTESFGDPSDPTLLLIAGLGGQGTSFEDELCNAFVSRGRHVIRYDNRDVGKSTLLDFETSPYTCADMAADAVGILDAYGVDAAHLVGGSMGGFIAQFIALDYPERVLSLTLTISSPALGEMAARPDDTDLAPMKPELMAVMMESAMSPPQTLEEGVEQKLALLRVLAGPVFPFEEERNRRLMTLEAKRARDWRGNTNQNLAAAASGPDLRPRLATLDVPALVVQGSEDPIFPDHGTALAKAIPGAKLITYEGMGHEMPSRFWPQWVDAIIEHTA